MQDDGDYGFWDDDGDRRLSGFDVSYHRRPLLRDRPANPLWIRLGTIAVLFLLLIPIAWMLRRADAAEPQIVPVTTSGSPASASAPAPGASGAQDVSEPIVVAAAIEPTSADDAPVTAAGPTSELAEPTTAPSAPADPQDATNQLVATEPGGATEIEAAPTPHGGTPTDEVAHVDPTVEVERVCANNYEVAAGDYWILIARKVSLPVADVLKANDATTDTPLYPGRVICLPWNASPPTTAPTPTVAATSAPTTTAKPTPTTAAPTTTAAPPKNTYTRAQVEQIIRDIWPDDLEDEAIRIATRESNLIPTVRNWCCFGLFQIYYNANRASLNSWGITSAEQLYDPVVNATAAFAIYQRAGGWGPWQ